MVREAHQPEVTSLKKIAEGREAEMFEWDDGLILRLPRDPSRGLQMEWEASALEAARTCGVRVPRFAGMAEGMGRPGMLIERIRGQDLLLLLGRKPWMVWSAGRTLGRVHGGMGNAVAPEGLPSLRAALWNRLQASDLIPTDVAKQAISVLEGLPDGDRLCHGDFHPANVMIDAQGPVTIDWTNAKRGNPDADLARSLVLMRLAVMPPGTNAVVRVASRFARSLLISGYLGAYEQVRPVDAEALRRWEFVRAVERLIEGIPEEREGVLRYAGKLGATFA